MKNKLILMLVSLSFGLILFTEHSSLAKISVLKSDGETLTFKAQSKGSDFLVRSATARSYMRVKSVPRKLAIWLTVADNLEAAYDEILNSRAEILKKQEPLIKDLQTRNHQKDEIVKQIAIIEDSKKVPGLTSNQIYFYEEQIKNFEKSLEIEKNVILSLEKRIEQLNELGLRQENNIRYQYQSHLNSVMDFIDKALDEKEHALVENLDDLSLAYEILEAISSLDEWGVEALDFESSSLLKANCSIYSKG